MAVHSSESLFIEIETDAGYKAVCVGHVASLVENKVDGTGQINFKANGYMSLDTKEWPIFFGKWRSCLGWLESFNKSGIVDKDEWRARANG